MITKCPLRAAVLAASLVLPSLASSVAVAATDVAAQPVAPPRPVVIEDLMQLRSVGAIDVSADGRHVVYTVTGAAWAGLAAGAEPTADTPTTTISHLWHIAIGEDGPGSPRRLVAGDDGVRAPAISPDGRHVAFVRAGATSAAWDGLPSTGDDGGRAPQVWIMPLAGGDAVQVTWFTRGAGGPRWSPDGTRLLVGTSVPVDAIDGRAPWPVDRPGADVLADEDADDADTSAATPSGTRRELRRWMAARAATQDPRVITRLDFQGERGLAGPPSRARVAIVIPAGFVFGDDPAPVASAGGAAATMQWATRNFDDAQAARWMAGGTRIAFAAPADARTHPDRVQRRIIASSSLEGRDVQPLVDLADWTLGRPRPTADGRLAFAARRMDHPSDRQWRIGLVDPAEQETPVRDEESVRWLTDQDTFDFSVGSMEWNGGRMLFTAAVRGGFPLSAVSPGLLEPAALVADRAGYPVGVQRFAAAGETIAWAETHPSNPNVLRLRVGRNEHLAHDLNPWVAERAISLPVPGTVARPRGLEVDYWVMEPVGLRPRETAPLVLQIHGGPSAMWGPGEASMWHEFQVLCGWGYGVVYANPRGSGGYGYDFQRANFQDWGQGPAGDVLAALDEATALEWVDREALMLTGGSYGGYLVAWILGNDDRFAAAVAQRGVYHLATFYGEGNAWRLLEWEMGGKPWEARMDPILRRESPFTYVTAMRSPLLIMHADRDLRTGVSQSEMLYRALRDLGRPVEYVRYPEAGHDLSRTGQPARRMDRVARIVEFFERFSGNRRSAPRSRD